MMFIKPACIAALVVAATSAVALRADAAPLPTNVAAIKAALDSPIVQARYGRGYGGWGGAIAAGATAVGVIAVGDTVAGVWEPRPWAEQSQARPTMAALAITAEAIPTTATPTPMMAPTVPNIALPMEAVIAAITAGSRTAEHSVIPPTMPARICGGARLESRRIATSVWSYLSPSGERR